MASIWHISLGSEREYRWMCICAYTYVQTQMHSCTVSSLYTNEFRSESACVSPICSEVQQSYPGFPTNTISYLVLYCNRSIILLTQIIHKNQTNTKNKHFSSYSTLKSTAVQYNSWHTGAGIEWTGKKSYWLEEGEEGGDGRAEGSSAIGDGGQAAVSLMPDTDGTGSGSLLDSIVSTLLKKWSSDVCVVALFFLVVDDPVALDCILNGCCNLRVPFYVWVLCLKN